MGLQSRWALWTIWFLAAGTAMAPAAGRPDEVRWQNLPNTNTVFEPARYESLAAWESRRTWLREQARFAAGLIPEPPRTPLNARVFGRLVRDGYTVEKACFESYPGFYVTGNLYRPAEAPGKVPAVACPHGHWKNGRLHQDDLGSIPARCITLARLGATVFAYDMIGYNDSGRQLQHREAALETPSSALWGIGPLHLQTWNSIRVLDFLQSLPEVDPGRIGVTGASGGGTQTFMLTAVDDRVTVACPVNMVSSIMQGGCSCENAPLLRIDTNNMEVAALAAPRPMLMISATGDWTKKTPEVEFPFVRSIYALYDAADHVANAHFDAPHNYNLASRQAMYPFFAKWLLGRDDAAEAKEGEIPVEKPEDLLVFADGKLPDNMLTVDQLIARLKQTFQARVDKMRPVGGDAMRELVDLVRAGVRHMVGSDLPPADQIQFIPSSQQERPDGSVVRLYVRTGRPVPALVFAPAAAAVASAKAWTICVHPEGIRAADALEKFIAAQVAEGTGVILIEPFTTGRPPSGTHPAGERNAGGYFTTFNRTDAAESVFDVLTVLGYELNRPQAPRLNLVGFGRMGPVCLVARTLVPEPLVLAVKLRTVIDMNGFDIESDEAYARDLFLPGIRRIGGLRACAAVATNGMTWFHNTGDAFDPTWVDQAASFHHTFAGILRDSVDAERAAYWVTVHSE